MEKFNLNDHPKIGDGFKVPTSYFESFAERVLSKVESTQVKVVPLYKNNYFRAAAAVILIALGTMAIWKGTEQDSIKDSEIENYLFSEAGFHEEELTAVLKSEDIEQIRIELNLDPEYLENILSDSPNLENYIVN